MEGAGCSAKSAAKHLAICYPTFRLYLAGSITPPDDVIVKIADAIGAVPDALIEQAAIQRQSRVEMRMEGHRHQQQHRAYQALAKAAAGLTEAIALLKQS